MEKVFDVVALGELLIDFTPAGYSAANMRLFEQNPGGAPANVLCTLSELGLRTSMIGKVGADMHGAFLKDTLISKAVDTGGLIVDEEVFTTLAFVELGGDGQRSFSFARKPGADTCLRSSELDRNLLESCKIFHFGSLSLTNEPSRTATKTAVQLAKQAGAIISYDPNYREPLWESGEKAAAQMQSVLNMVDIIKISDEEMTLITGQNTAEAAADFLLDQGVSCVVITLGADGSYAKTRACAVQAPAFPAEAVDSTGAGDAFWGSFLYGMIDGKHRAASIAEQELFAMLRFSNAAASLCVRKYGAIPSIPTMAEVRALLR